MQPPFRIQTPRLAEYPALVKLWDASVRATHHFLPQAYIDQIKPLIADHYLYLVMLACAVDRQRRIAGFVGVSHGRVEMLFIDPARRGQGVGKLLLWHAVEQFNATELDVNEQNPQALGFYLRQGFEVVGRSDFDGLGQPYPLLHLRLNHAQARIA
ncbi:acetyltransferase [Pseudomonas sp. NPDC007930]|uniref:acetyltransferase n=1 Tax=Pseudomonas sp. NPDC007930 TaxID=3364417 RepID=UPI0036E7E624